MIVFIDRQHAGQINKLKTRGATYDVDGDGVLDREALITGEIAIKLEKILLLLGIDVMPISDGKYSERHQRVNEYAAMYPNRKTIYLAMHLNAGGGSYGAFFHHYASASGEKLAKQMCAEMIGNDIVKTCKAIEARPNDWTKNAFYTIKGVGRPVALCCEPLFMDNDEHAKMLNNDGIHAIATAMATGILKWGNNG